MTSLLLVLLPLTIAQDSPGSLIIVGGGRLPTALAEKALDLAGGKNAYVLVISEGSQAAGASQAARHEWKELGARHVKAIDIRDARAAAREIRQADLIWMGGGKQEKLMDFFDKKGLTDLIRERFRQGAVVGGTSAGAAVLSQITLDGASRTDINVAREIKGLGLLPDAIIDTHFGAREREPRLRHAVENHPDKLGIGIDPSTGILVRGNTFEVLGDKTVQVLSIPKSDRTPKGAIVTQTLKPGMTYNLDRRARVSTTK